MPNQRAVCLLLAEIARSSLGALPASQSIYATTTRDSQNRTLDASTGNNYTVTFPLPLPARAFWSLTLYNATSMAFVDNTINRYSIGDNVSTPLVICNDMTLHAAHHIVWLWYALPGYCRGDAVVLKLQGTSMPVLYLVIR